MQALEASMEAPIELPLKYAEASTIHIEVSVEAASMKLPRKLWKLPREVWSTTTEAIIPETSGCLQGSFDHHFHNKSQSLLSWKLL